MTQRRPKKFGTKTLFYYDNWFPDRRRAVEWAGFRRNDGYKAHIEPVSDGWEIWINPEDTRGKVVITKTKHLGKKRIY